MYISELRLWNFRKYTADNGNIDLLNPHLRVSFKSGLNVLIGENDSGKTAIIDAIKLITKTNSLEWIHLTDDDFTVGTKQLRIELTISDLSDAEAAKFMDKIAFDENHNPYLNIVLSANKTDERILPYDVQVSYGEASTSLNSAEKDFLRSTYLKPLRDADSELIGKKNSRFAQILLGHKLFAEGGSGKDKFEQIFQDANNSIKEWFDESNGDNNNKMQIKDVIDSFIHQFISNDASSEFSVSGSNIKSILEKISVGLSEIHNSGLGTMNRLFMATELLHLKKENIGLRLCLIEELEAHLHPQAQMKVIQALQKESTTQFILTTHSPNLASKIKLNAPNTSVILCKGIDAYPLDKGKTKLDDGDYVFLDHFLDVTKSNLFFAKGVILVEGWAEELLLPVIATKLGYDLTEHEVSIVNVGSTAYLHYAKILMRNDGKALDYPVSIVTDMDIRPNDGVIDEEKENDKLEQLKNDLDVGANKNVKLFVAKHWTLEWCLFKSKVFSDDFMEACANVHSKTQEFKKVDGEWNVENFSKKLEEKLRNRTLDKVAIATMLSEKLSESQNLDIDKDDEAYYLSEAIKFVCP
jgi:putative ATP-dependent endonuclease of OLD family